MHEMSIVSNIVDMLDAQLNDYDILQVKKVKIVVGELTGIEKDTISFCWQIYTENTKYHGSVLEMERKPAVAVCRNCLKQFFVKNGYTCPNCSGGIEKFISGRELYVDYVEGE